MHAAFALVALALGAASAAAQPAAAPPPEPAAPAPQPAAPVEITIIPASLVARVLGQPGLEILDLNAPEEYALHHVPGARHVGEGELAAALPRDRTTELVFYCSGPDCGVAEAAAREAARLGYRNLYVMEDGIAAWVAAGWPTVRGGPAAPVSAAPDRAAADRAGRAPAAPSSRPAPPPSPPGG
jgi:rhodanese-related sulfurtransferase